MASILFKGKEILEKTGETPAFFVDLNLDQIIDRITEDWGGEIRDLFYIMPDGCDEEEYRRGVYRDICKDDTYDNLMTFLDLIKERNECKAKIEDLADHDQRNVWYLREVGVYFEAVELLKSVLANSNLKSEGINRLRDFIKTYTDTKEYIELSKTAEKLLAELRSFRVLVTYENGKIYVDDGIGGLPYEEFLGRNFPGANKKFRTPFSASDELSDLEDAVIRLYKKSHKEFFGKIASFAKNKDKYVNSEIMNLPKEFSYYLSFIKFMNKMKERGFTFCDPEAGSEKLSAIDMYDLALACTNYEARKEVVSNDFDLRDGEKFIVLTGPNQGGKTTFARSLGQMIYFTKMGLSVAAERACVPYYTQILSHFSVEESAETGRGKLMDELVRLKPMMNKEYVGAFVVINELFTTAANFDACEMGKKVLDFFIGNGCYGIYVTHLNDLAKSHENVVSFRAATDENAKQTFKVGRENAREIAGANTQVEKYRLTYSQIKERFS